MALSKRALSVNYKYQGQLQEITIVSGEKLQTITASFVEAVNRIDALGGRRKFDMGDDGIVFLNGTVTPCAVSNGDSEADCVVEIDIDTLADMLAGRIDSRTAFVQGKLCLIGDMSLALKLASLLNTGDD